MTSKAKFFICRNEQCEEKNKKKNPLKKIIFPYKPKKGGSFHCSYCKSEYKEENGNIYYKAANEIVIDNIKAYEDFNTQYETVRIYFPKLVLKNIKELSYEGRIISFSKCIIDDLIIEDVEIISAYYPMSFSECEIKNISIINTRVIQAKIKDYYSAWSFFGINFFRTKIKDSFKIKELET
ncbi:MAG: hypothetical protein HQ565_05985, partial [Bacteroidetes bacterium]|nr:hypothetical protein [Bacteroidota bacterium]